MESGDSDKTRHTEFWCDTDLHVLPVPEGREDPGCFRLMELSGIWWMIHRIGRQIVVSDDHGNIFDLEIFRAWVDVAIQQIAFVPRQQLSA